MTEQTPAPQGLTMRHYGRFLVSAAAIALIIAVSLAFVYDYQEEKGDATCLERIIARNFPFNEYAFATKIDQREVREIAEAIAWVEVEKLRKESQDPRKRASPCPPKLYGAGDIVQRGRSLRAVRAYQPHEQWGFLFGVARSALTGQYRYFRPHLHPCANTYASKFDMSPNWTLWGESVYAVGPKIGSLQLYGPKTCKPVRRGIPLPSW